MPGGFPIGFDVCAAAAHGITASTSSGTNVASSATVHTKGSWVQLVASSTRDCCLLEVVISNEAVNNALIGAVDIGVGGAGSEVVVLQNLIVDAGYAEVAYRYLLPVNIPAGSRIAARSQVDTTGAQNIRVSVTAFEGGFSQSPGAAGVDAIGFVAAATNGTTIDPGGTANTKGAYAELIAATARDYFGLVGTIDGLTGHTSTLGNNNMLLDIAIGAAGSEQIINPDQRWRSPSNSFVMLTPSPFYPINIPAGSRLAARAQVSSITSTPGRTFGLTLYGVYK